MNKYVTVIALLLLPGMALCQGLTGKYQHTTTDGQTWTLLLQEHPYGATGYLMPSYGIRFDIESDREQSSSTQLIGQLATEEPVSFEAQLEDNKLVVTLAESEVLDFERVAPQEIAEPSRLLEMLQFIPDDSDTRDGFPFIQYINLWALFEAYQTPLYQSQSDYQAQTDQAYDCQQSQDPFGPTPAFTEAATALEPALQRMVFATENLSSLRSLALMFTCMPATVGFSFFDMEALLQSDKGRFSNELIIAAAVDQTQLQAVLSARDFEQVALAETLTMRRFDDHAMQIRERNLADLFGGHMGRAARIATLDQHIVSSGNDHGLESQLEAYQDKRPSLAQAADIRSLVRSLEAYGSIVQAGFFNTIDIGFIASDPLAGMVLGSAQESEQAEVSSDSEQQSTAAALPFFGLSMLAEVNADGQQYTLWALLFEDKVAAEQAQQSLATRLASSLAKMEGQEAEIVAAELIESEAGHVVLAGLKRDWPKPEQNPTILRSWFASMLDRDFQLLSLE